MASISFSRWAAVKYPFPIRVISPWPPRKGLAQQQFLALLRAGANNLLDQVEGRELFLISTSPSRRKVKILARLNQSPIRNETG